MGERKWISDPLAYEPDHLQPFKLILLSNFFKVSSFILGGQFLLPQRANNEKREFSQLQKWLRIRGFCAWGIQTGPFKPILFSQFYNFFTFILEAWSSAKFCLMKFGLNVTSVNETLIIVSRNLLIVFK